MCMFNRQSVVSIYVYSYSCEITNFDNLKYRLLSVSKNVTCTYVSWYRSKGQRPSKYNLVIRCTAVPYYWDWIEWVTMYVYTDLYSKIRHCRCLKMSTIA